jgi:hypothetical protein
MGRPTAWVRGGLLGASLLLAVAGIGESQTFSSGSTGADGAFNPTANTTLTLPSNGVFNFTTINIPAGVTVTFTRNAANTPVLLLATGDVTINGTLDVSAGAGSSFGRPGRGGPGGFDGGAGADGVNTTLAGFGLGPGGGAPGNGATAGGGGGGYGTAGTSGGAGTGSGGTPGAGGPAYGSVVLRPILGGSGGGGGGGILGQAVGGGGGGGGGAIVIASSTRVAFNTGNILNALLVRANGGDGSSTSGAIVANGGGGGSGSGGAIRVIAPTISGNGRLEARAGLPGSFNGGTGAPGRTRLEAATLSFFGTTNPLATAGLPQPVFPGTGQPALTIASVGGVAAPASPSGSLLAAPDILLPTGTTSPVEVVLTASNIPVGTAVLVTATPQSGARTTATSGGLAGSLASSTATGSLTVSLTQTSVLTATATFPLVAAAGQGPIYAEGEEVKWVRVASTFGGGSTVIYVTASGKEVAAERLATLWP